MIRIFLKKFNIFLCNKIIPIVAIYVNCILILHIRNGLYISNINKDIDILVHISFFLCKIFDIKNMILITLALTTDGLNPVNIIYITKNTIIKILLLLFPNILFSINDNPYYDI